MTQEPNPPSKASSKASSKTPSKVPPKAAPSQRLLGQLGGIAQAVLSALFKLTGNLLRSAGKLWWNTILPSVQGLLPAPWNRRLSKPVLTGIAIALLTLILWLTSTLNRPAVSSVSESPAAPSEEVRAPQPKASRPEAAPSPEKLTRIQEKLAQVTEPYGEALIASVQPGVRQHLTLTLDDRWYRLPAETQDRLARELWDRSRQFDYSQLEILDLEDQRIARSPVVGQQMLILQRSSDRVLEEDSQLGEAAIEPTSELSPEPVSGSAAESALESVAEPTGEPALESVVETETPAVLELPKVE